jgi:ATP-dependent DNA ligase I
MLLAEIVSVSRDIASTRSRKKKVALLAATLTRLNPGEAPIGIAYLTGRPRQDRLGIGFATIYAVSAEPAAESELEIVEVDAALETMASLTGPGSKLERETKLRNLMSRATLPEQVFLRDLILRNLRQGALEGIMNDAVAAAIEVPPDRVRRAAMLEGDLVMVAARALSQGAASLGVVSLAVMTPVQPMLAKTAATAGEAVARLGSAFVEWKLDGARIQIHRLGKSVRIFTRNLRDITDGVPEIARAVLSLEAKSLILDGEALLIGPGGSPKEFQDSMSRFGSESSGGPALTGFYFDCLHLDGVDLIDEPLVVRHDRLAGVLPGELQVGSILTDDPLAADRFFEQAIGAGYEGVVVKDPMASYEAGRRGSGWLKVKPTHSLDLVVLAAEWGSGRREGWLSNLHLGARDGAGGWVMLGKTFKGLTDEMLAWQTERFLEIETHRQSHVVFLRPEVVYEIAFDGVQRSSRYPGGVALRFARVKRYRDDKGPEEADTIEAVRAFVQRGPVSRTDSG